MNEADQLKERLFRLLNTAERVAEAAELSVIKAQSLFHYAIEKWKEEDNFDLLSTAYAYSIAMESYRMAMSSWSISLANTSAANSSVVIPSRSEFMQQLLASMSNEPEDEGGG